MLFTCGAYATTETTVLEARDNNSIMQGKKGVNPSPHSWSCFQLYRLLVLHNIVTGRYI